MKSQTPSISSRKLPQRLSKAIRKGKLEEAEMILLQGADANLPDPTGTPPLVLAAENGKDELVRLLLKRGANPNTKDTLGNTALHLAASSGNTRVLGDLILGGAAVDSVNHEGLTPLMCASMAEGHDNAINLLLAHGADLEYRQQTEDFTALMWAYMANNFSGMTLLVESGARFTKRDKEICDLAEQKITLLFRSRPS